MRLDGRSESKQLRQFSASQNVLNRADGSAKFAFGETSVLVSVVGPVEAPLRDEKLNEATVELIVRPAVGFVQTKDKLTESILRSTFEPVILGGLLPRTLVQIVVQINKDDGSVLAAAVNAISLALLDAGIPMKNLAGAVTCAIVPSSDEILLDPTAAELENATSVHTFSHDNQQKPPNGLLLSESSGQFSEEQYFACHGLCLEAIEKVHAFLRVAVETKKEKEQQQISS